MNHPAKRVGLPLTMLLCGTVAMMLRRQLYRTAVDVRGLLLRGTPLEILLLALTGTVFVLLFLALKQDRGSNLYEQNYSASLPAALGHGAAAMGIVLLVRSPAFTVSGLVGQLWLLLGLAAPVCLVLAGILRSLGKKPFFLLHVVPCLFLLAQVVGCYRLWSSNPQMQDYLFALLASLSLVLFAHHTAAFEADIGSRKMTLGSGLAAVYLCLAELGRTEHPFFYFGCMLWAVTGVCRAVPTGEEKG